MTTKRDYIILKTIEELTELQEVLIKFITKPVGAFEGDRKQHLIEELGDASMRIDQLTENLELAQSVYTRYCSKAEEVGFNF